MLLRSRAIIPRDAVDQQENSQNIFNQKGLSRSTRSLERPPNKSFERVPQRVSRRTFRSSSEKDSPKASDRNERHIESDLSTAANESIRSDQTSKTFSSTEHLPTKRKKSSAKSKKSTHLERIQEEYDSISKCIHSQTGSKFRPFDCVRPTYLLKEALNLHRLNEITRLYALNAKEKFICPYLLSKTGLLLLRKFIESRPETEEELCSDLVNFVKHVRFLTGRSLVVLVPFLSS